MKVYLYDLVGIKSGMNYYLDSFQKLLKDNDIDAVVRSNYDNDGLIFYRYMFTENLFGNIVNMVLNLIKFKLKTIFSKDISIFLFYGTYVDLIFFFFFFRSKKVIIDLHETIPRESNSVLLKLVIPILFKFSKNTVIFHSQKIENSILKYGFTNEMIYVSHFKYKLKKKYQIKNLGLDIINAIVKAPVNYLLFGNITKTKGVLELLDLIEYCNNNARFSNANFIVAGQDLNRVIKKSKYESTENVDIITRHINHDELVYLFSKCRFILLPYKNVSQSGVLEMAIDFEKQIITSNLKYFKDILSKYKSFGYSFDLNDENSFLDVISNSLLNIEAKITKKDIEEYKGYNEFDVFVKKIKQLM
jgi:hypothetical protein